MARWFSGLSSAGTLPDLKAGTLAAYRKGRRVNAYRRWTDNTLKNMQMVGHYFSEIVSGPNVPYIIDLAIGGPQEGHTWSTAANNIPVLTDPSPQAADQNPSMLTMAQIVRSQFQQIHAVNWGPLQMLTISLAHEMNGDWKNWSVPVQYSGTIASADDQRTKDFITFWRMVYQIMQEELVSKGRNVKLVINYAAGRGGVNAMYPGDPHVDVIAPDVYDAYKGTPLGAPGHITTQAQWDAWVYSVDWNGDPVGIGAYQQFALAHGKPMAVPEWGLSDTDTPLDNAFWIQKMLEFFYAHAPNDPLNPGPGEILMEVLYTDGAYPGTVMYQDETTNPLSRALYADSDFGGTGWPPVAGDIAPVAPSGPVASFTATPTSGPLALFTQFDSTASTDAVEWYWDFGDGTTSRQQNPAKYYIVEGYWSPSLIVKNASGVASAPFTRTNYIIAGAPAPITPGAPMATQQDRLSALITRIGTEFKTVKSSVTTVSTAVGTLASLTTTAKGSLVDAINEVNAKPSGTGGAAIADGATASTTTWSSTRITTEVTNQRAALKAEILGGAGAAFDTLQELKGLLDASDSADDTALAALVTADGNRLRVDVANQGLTTTQQQNGRTNLNAYGAVELGNPDADLVALLVAALA